MTLTSAERVIEAATDWWLLKVPLSMTYDEHFDNPEVNCSGQTEKMLARAVVAHLRTAQSQENSNA